MLPVRCARLWERDACWDLDASRFMLLEAAEQAAAWPVEYCCQAVGSPQKLERLERMREGWELVLPGSVV